MARLLGFAAVVTGRRTRIRFATPESGMLSRSTSIWRRPRPILLFVVLVLVGCDDQEEPEPGGGPEPSASAPLTEELTVYLPDGAALIATYDLAAITADGRLVDRDPADPDRAVAAGFGVPASEIERYTIARVGNELVVIFQTSDDLDQEQWPADGSKTIHEIGGRGFSSLVHDRRSVVFGPWPLLESRLKAGRPAPLAEGLEMPTGRAALELVRRLDAPGEEILFNEIAAHPFGTLQSPLALAGPAHPVLALPEVDRYQLSVDLGPKLRYRTRVRCREDADPAAVEGAYQEMTAGTGATIERDGRILEIVVELEVAAGEDR